MVNRPRYADPHVTITLVCKDFLAEIGITWEKDLNTRNLAARPTQCWLVRDHI